MMNNRYFIDALRAAVAGITQSFKSERNFRIHSIAAAVAILFGFLLHLTVEEWRWIVLSIAVVLLTELVNTALEALTDLVMPDYHNLAKKAKDAAAGAVLIAAIFSLTCGSIIFLPKLVSLIR